MLSSVPSLGGIQFVEHFLNTENTRVSDETSEKRKNRQT